MKNITRTVFALLFRELQFKFTLSRDSLRNLFSYFSFPVLFLFHSTRNKTYFQLPQVAFLFALQNCTPRSMACDRRYAYILILSAVIENPDLATGHHSAGYKGLHDLVYPDCFANRDSNCFIGSRSSIFPSLPLIFPPYSRA